MQQSMKKFLDNIFFPTIDKHGCTHLIHAGDFVDRRKFVNYQTAGFIYNSYIRPLQERAIEQLVLIGNHDIFLRQSTEINAVEELYRHMKHITVVRNPVEMKFAGLDLLLLPWMCDDNRARSMELIQTSSAPIVIGHLEIMGFQMFRGLPSTEGLDPALFDRFEMVLSGHYHHRSQQGPITYLGAPYPMIWSDYRDPRGFHLYDTETKQLEFVENPYSLFTRLVYDDEGKKHDYIKDIARQILAPDSNFHNAYVKVVVKSKNQPYWFDLMMDALYKVTQDVLVIDDIIVHDEDDKDVETTQDVDTLELMRDYVNSLSISCDKQELHNYLRSLYQEALASTQSARLT